VTQFLRIYACALGLCLGGCVGALSVDGILGERQRERDRAAHPDDVRCGGAGIDVYLAGGFFFGSIIASWLLMRLEAFRWINGPCLPDPGSG